MAAYNALGIFFGISQTRTPKEIFGRSILILFIWFCLIIRTCYQSMLFEFMTGDMRKPLPVTTAEAIEGNYTIAYTSHRLKQEKFITELTGQNIDRFNYF
jgi:hypothetical protein